VPELQLEAIKVMTNAFRQMEALLPPPKRHPLKGSFVFRFENKGIHEALIQKLARYISGLNAIEVLLEAGYTQEIGVLFRTLDEIQEDCFFLASAETNDARTERHTQYLDAFYADAVSSRPKGELRISKPNMLPRKKVRAHTVNALGQGINQSNMLDASESVGTAYSGYVHAASENIMEMYGGYPPRFHLEGLSGTPLITTFTRERETYIYRGLIVVALTAKAFGDKALVDALYKFLAKYELANGHEVPKSGSNVM